MSSELLLILDDASSNFNYSCGEWTRSTLVQWYGKTAFYPEFAEGATQLGSFTLTFEGTSVAFIGNTPQTVSALSQLATVTIDGGQPYNITYGDLDPPSYIQWYQSPTLADGSHTISLDRLAGTAVDFALISVGPETSLSGKTIFVDDNDSAIQYTGKWTRNTNKFVTGKLPHGYPVGNTTHRSSTPGDTITFHFSGSSLSVYGIFSWGTLGVLSATYSLDGNTVTNTLSVTTSTPQYVNNFGETSNVLMFSDSTIQPGDHTLVVNITECANKTFVLDYITYLPSFSSLATMPILENATTSVANASTSTMQSMTQSPTASQIINDGDGMRAKTGAIVGGVVGGLAITLLIILLLFFLRKRRGKENDPQDNLTTVHEPPLPRASCRGLGTIQSRINPTQTLFPFQRGPTVHHGLGSAVSFKRSRANFANQQRFGDFVAPQSGGPQNDSSLGEAQFSSLPIRANLDTRNAVDSEPPSYDGLSINHPSRRAAGSS